ncbi:MAG: carboxypeptidase-like regulatory domain-containing protein [Nitrospiraceae bacterium]|nr:carboxypeptidase-like regulatory domain-containing protein [Nitrospiraceae bacterium]
MKKWLAFFIVFTISAFFSAGMAMANGTITATVLYNGQPLQNAYIYLQRASQLPPREMYYMQAADILGPSDANGNIRASVPEGAYYVRITKRANSSSRLGPPYTGDYTWFYTGSPATITVTTNGVVALGAVNTEIYGGQSITISGTVKGSSGNPLAGWAVKATTAPCESGDWAYPHSFNECGAAKYPALTDSNGNYTITIKDTGTYYVYASPDLNFANTSYPGGYPTCATGVGCEACGGYFYYNCPINVTGAMTGENIVVPGY